MADCVLDHVATGQEAASTRRAPDGTGRDSFKAIGQLTCNCASSRAERRSRQGHAVSPSR